MRSLPSDLDCRRWTTWFIILNAFDSLFHRRCQLYTQKWQIRNSNRMERVVYTRTTRYPPAFVSKRSVSLSRNQSSERKWNKLFLFTNKKQRFLRYQQQTICETKILFFTSCYIFLHVCRVCSKNNLNLTSTHCVRGSVTSSVVVSSGETTCTTLFGFEIRAHFVEPSRCI